jgi:hypothetical protein
VVDEESFIRVWNWGTIEFKDVAMMFKEYDFHDLQSKLGKEKQSSRGKLIKSAGFSQQNLRKKDAYHLNQPNTLTGTDNVHTQMIQLSKLLHHCWHVDRPTDRIDYAETNTCAGNTIEGFSFAKTLVASYDREQNHFDITNQQYVPCHCDINNCRTQGSNYLIIASEIQQHNDDIYRIAAIGYGRSSVFHYLQRQKKLTPFLITIHNVYFEILIAARHYAKLIRHGAYLVPTHDKDYTERIAVCMEAICSIHNLEQSDLDKILNAIASLCKVSAGMAVQVVCVGLIQGYRCEMMELTTNNKQNKQFTTRCRKRVTRSNIIQQQTESSDTIFQKAIHLVCSLLLSHPRSHLLL